MTQPPTDNNENQEQPLPPGDLAKQELAKRILSRRRLIHFTKSTLPEYEAGWVHNDMAARLERFSREVTEKKSPRLMLLVPPRHGKAVCDETPVFTQTRGWITHGELLPGDFVFHPSGRPVVIKEVADPVTGDCEVEFSDGEKIRCHENHEWTVYDRRRAQWATYETRELPDILAKSTRGELLLPPTFPLHGRHTRVPVDPYTLGVWLGDGMTDSGVICGAPEDLDKIVARLPSYQGFGAVRMHANTGCKYVTLLHLRTKLRALGVLGCKHIPDVYFSLPEAHRRELLGGIVDTDGSLCKRDGRIRVCTNNLGLAYDIRRLARGLGYRVTIQYRPADRRERKMRWSGAPIKGGGYWVVGWVPYDRSGGGLALERKIPTRSGRPKYRTVRAVRRVEPFSARCIEVMSTDGLYLVGEALIPTHNSELASIRLPAWHLGHNPTHGIINAGYNLDLPMIFSRKVRGLLRDPYYHSIFPDTQLDPESQATETWATTKSGGYVAAGVGGGLTGKGCHILIIDDPIKNMEEADSADRRLLIDEWYQSTASTRVAPGGGILLIECMTGDTPVLMADGSEKTLQEVRAGDVIASYEDGRRVDAIVAAQRLSGRDKVWKIKTSSGRVVRANERHPFLTVDTAGALQWTRTHSLNIRQKIVVYPGSGESGEESSVPTTGASCRPDAADCARATTTRPDGLAGTAPKKSWTQFAGGLGTSNTDMESRPLSMTRLLLRRMVDALSAMRPLKKRMSPSIGSTCCASTTATTLGRSDHCYATGAMSQSGSFELSAMHSPQLNTSEFTAEEIVEISPAGEADVYDLQVARTENFIANGLVTHNTWWNYDDLAGRLQQRMRLDPMADQFEVVLYPALSTTYEYRDEESPRHEIIRTAEPIKDAPEHYTLLRGPDQALHEERYSTNALHKIRANLQPRIWSALYQQAPVPDEGLYFRKEHFRFEHLPPLGEHVNYYTAWDFAIGLKQQNDFTVGATIAHDDYDHAYVSDLVRFRGDSFEIVDSIVTVAERYMRISGGRYVVGVEDGQIWRSIEPLLRKRMDERKVFPTIEVMKPLTDKVARARPLQGRMQQGKVSFPMDPPWKTELLQEMLQFPGGGHDDIVDALAWAIRLITNAAPPRLPDPPKVPSWRDKILSTESGGNLTHMTS